MVSVAYAQNATPAPVEPTVSQAPVQTSPTPNFQYLPQKAYVQPYGPEVGVPQNSIPLTSVPQVIPAPVQPAQQTQSGIAGLDSGTILGIISTLAGAGALLKSKLVGDKTNKVEETTKQQSAQIVKGAEVDQSLAKQVFNNMPDKGESIHDAPEIKLEILQQNKEEALDTAAKS